MTDPLKTLPGSPRVFDGTRAERYVALSLETVIQDVSLSGDRETAMALGGYVVGEEPPPAGVPAFVELDDDKITISNPPFLLADVTLAAEDGPHGDAYTLTAAFDSYLHLLIEPPVRVTYRGDLVTVVAEFEQTIAEVYRTRGRHLEKLIEGGVVK